MNSYEINNDTLAILPLNEYKSKIIEIISNLLNYK